MDPFFKIFVKFQGYLIAIACIYANLVTMVADHIILHYTRKDIFDYEYMGKTIQFFKPLWIAVGFFTLFGIYKEKRKFLYPFTILFTMDLLVLFIRDIVVIWISHPWVRIHLLTPVGALEIIATSLYVMATLAALGKLFDSEISAKSEPSFIRFKVNANGTEELLEENTVVLP
uniref:Uncharacterized protein n=1 Tax=Culex tarsalis TaxID=7177 RepID=A0A1Q3F1L8_CULTA